MLAPWKESYDKSRQHTKKQGHHFTNKGLYSQAYGFSTSHIWMWELDHKEGWVPKNWCFSTVVLERTLQSSLDWKEIKPFNPKGNQPWILIGSEVKSLSRVWLFATPWIVAYQAPQSMEFFRQEYWSRLSFPPLGDLPDSGIKSMSPMSPALAGRFFTTASSVHPCNKMSNQFLVEAAFFPHSTAPLFHRWFWRPRMCFFDTVKHLQWYW